MRRFWENAAEFFTLSDKSTAEELLKQAQEVEPDSPQWSERLGRLYHLDMNRARGEKRRSQAAKALKQFERAMELQQDSPEETYYLLGDVAELALEAGELDKARRFATQLLKTSRERKRDWNFGNAVHHGHLILGRLALRNDRVDEAKSHLLKAGKTPGSPQLNSFGPNMAPAKELLEKGEKHVVLEYFALCAKFWDREELKEWTAAVEAGETPKFGANLAY
jgi:tetratricopeptide (TPR) repeat protein